MNRHLSGSINAFKGLWQPASTDLNTSEAEKVAELSGSILIFIFLSLEPCSILKNLLSPK
jgi:hypothetical protein